MDSVDGRLLRLHGRRVVAGLPAFNQVYMSIVCGQVGKRSVFYINLLLEALINMQC